MNQITTEEYLETIGALAERENPVSTSSIAQSMGVSQASVSEMLRRLSEKKLVDYVPYGGATLTDEGFRKFLHLTRRHRLWEVFLNRYLGIDWADVYEHACNLEHTTSDIVAERLDIFLGTPSVCPHGCPIPDRNLQYDILPAVTLASLTPGTSATIARIIVERDSNFLRYVSSLGITPGCHVQILDKAEFDGTLTVQIAGDTKAIGRDAASLIMTRPL